MLKHRIRHLLLGIVALLTAVGVGVPTTGFSSSGNGDTAVVDEATADGPSFSVTLPNTTAGPPWPPSEFVDKNGDFVLVGALLQEVTPGINGLVPFQAVIVSKDTIPPLDAKGREDFRNWFGATHKVVRTLDLSPGSKDLDIELFTLSFGPLGSSEGGFSPRIPRQGDSLYNLNGLDVACPEQFPSDSQQTYSRRSYRFHEVPVWGFRGDQVRYDADTGAPIPVAEPRLDARGRQPLTLGRWLKANGKVKVTLTRFNQEAGGYTHARFDLQLRDLLPNAVVSVWALRQQIFPQPDGTQRQVDPLLVPNFRVTDKKGDLDVSFEVRNPFPDPATDDRQVRLFGLSINIHGDLQNWGACYSRFGVGADGQPMLNTGQLGPLTDLITVEPPQ